MSKIYKILGKRGRITIPFEIRQHMGFKHNDVVSFEETENHTIAVKREKICDECRKTEIDNPKKPTDEISLLEFLDGLSYPEQRAALIHLTVKWAEQERVKNNGK